MASRREMLTRLATTAVQLQGYTTPAGRLCEAARSVADADGASLTLAQGDQGVERVVLWSTDRTAARLEDIQDSLGEGPTFDALRQGVVVDVGARAMPSRWPLFAGLVERDTAISRISAFPMRAAGASLGVLLLYLAQPGRFAYDDDDLAALADVVAVMLMEETPMGGLPAAPSWGDRSTVNQASGMVMAQLSIGPADALALLRAHAYAGDTTLLHVANQVLNRTLRFEPPETT